MRTLIENATVVLPEGTAKTSVLVEDGRIAAVDPAAHTRADEVVHAEGLHLIPGVIDDQVHFREPGLTHKEDFAHATRACAKGGVTTFLEMPNTIPQTTTQERLAEKLALAATKCLVNFGFYMGATTSNLDELRSATRTPGIKIFIGSSTGDLLVDEQEALERIFAETSLPICAHCEDEATIRANRKAVGAPSGVADHSRIRDHQAAFVATSRAADLATRHRHRFHVLHVSTVAELAVIDAAREYLTCEVCPHHLFFNVSDYERLGTLVQMNPSVKYPEDNEGLLKALAEGRIDVVATDHAPHTLDEKNRPYPESPSGLPAVENSLALMLDQVNRGRFTIEQVVTWMCTNPARVWNIRNKGEIREGWDADLVLVDMNKTATILNESQETKCRWSPWHGTELTGWAVRTWVMGREVFRDGRIDGTVRGREASFDV